MKLRSNLKNSRMSIELFSGAGGLALATHFAGFKHRGLFEWNSDACQTLVKNSIISSIQGIENWTNNINEGDVSERIFNSFENIDLVAGGPPCQPFSLGGKHRGMADTRDMIPQFIRAVREAKPKSFLMENVRGLTRKSFFEYLNYSILQLTFPELEMRAGEQWEDHWRRLQKQSTSKYSSQTLKYNVNAAVLNSADFGVPQCRERLFVVGFRSDINANWSFPKQTHSIDRLIYDQGVSKEYWRRNGIKEHSINPSYASRLGIISKHEEPSSLAWRTIRESISDLPKPFIGHDSNDLIYNHRFQPGAKPYPGHTGSHIDAPSKTLKAGAHGVPGGENMIDFGNGKYRYLTIREAARIQTFPDQWKFEGAWSEAMRQIGNAVPVNLASIVASSIYETLDLKAA